MNTRTYSRLVRSSGIYDLLVTAGFATPWTFAIVHQLLGHIYPMPAFAPVHVLFANLLGSLVVVWSVLRIWNPQPMFGLADAVARGLFLTWQLYYLLAMDGIPTVWFFAGFEFLFGVTQAYGFWLLYKGQLILFTELEAGERNSCASMPG